MTRKTINLSTIIKLIIFSVIGPLATCHTVDASSAAYEPKYEQLDVVLVGDSYSAGNGAGHYYAKNDGCYRSLNNWATEYVDYLRGRMVPVNFSNHACSGAKTSDLDNVRTGLRDKQIQITLNGDARNKSIDALSYCHGYSSDITYPTASITKRHYNAGRNQTAISISCRQDVKAELDAINNETDLVLLTIGGNDINFAEIIKQCFALGSGADCKKQIGKAIEAIENNTLTTNLTNVFDAMYRRGLREDANIILLGYPFLSTDVDYFIHDIFFINKYNVAQEVRNLGRLGDQAQQSAIRNYLQRHPNRKIAFLNAQIAFASLEPNPSFFSANPAGAINELFQPGLDQSEWYHPSAYGHIIYASLLKALPIDSVAKPLPEPPTPPETNFIIHLSPTVTRKIIANNQSSAGLSTSSGSSGGSSSGSTGSTSSGTSGQSAPQTNQTKPKTQNVLTKIINTVANAVQNFFTSIITSSPFSRSRMRSLPATNIGMIAQLDDQENISETLTNLFDDLADDKISWTSVNQLEKIPADSSVILINITDDDSLADPQDSTIESLLADVQSLQHFSVNLDQFNDETGELLITDHQQTATISLADLQQTLTRNQAPKSQPVANIDSLPITKLGESVTLDVRGSFVPVGDITRFDWDVDNDGVIDFSTDNGQLSFTPTQEYTGEVRVIITDQFGRIATATTELTVTIDGDSIPDDIDNCPYVANGSQLDWDNDGLGNECDPDLALPANGQWTEADYERLRQQYIASLNNPETETIIIDNGTSTPDNQSSANTSSTRDKSSEVQSSDKSQTESNTNSPDSESGTEQSTKITNPNSNNTTEPTTTDKNSSSTANYKIIFIVATVIISATIGIIFIKKAIK